jgi:hypothetical protein
MKLVLYELHKNDTALSDDLKNRLLPPQHTHKLGSFTLNDKRMKAA